ncbi:unnamed protein product [Notodromas monacha]|uniref:Uncharacterized protein n=1 Tax=Notodromas monacha TaxID=399045 RepID=A0A7R9BWN1_9CRUS|nr:unnamed protein product [Notodromas monacha]CAG0921487.1 unnamed protein product [Notodromas monacha]
MLPRSKPDSMRDLGILEACSAAFLSNSFAFFFSLFFLLLLIVPVDAAAAAVDTPVVIPVSLAFLELVEVSRVEGTFRGDTDIFGREIGGEVVVPFVASVLEGTLLTDVGESSSRSSNSNGERREISDPESMRNLTGKSVTLVAMMTTSSFTEEEVKVPVSFGQEFVLELVVILVSFVFFIRSYLLHKIHNFPAATTTTTTHISAHRGATSCIPLGQSRPATIFLGRDIDKLSRRLFGGFLGQRAALTTEVTLLATIIAQSSDAKVRVTLPIIHWRGLWALVRNLVEGGALSRCLYVLLPIFYQNRILDRGLKIVKTLLDKERVWKQGSSNNFHKISTDNEYGKDVRASSLWIRLGTGQSELKVGSWILNSANLQGAHVVDPYLCKALEEMLFQNKSVLDLGCGIGLYGICFLRLSNHTFPNSERDFFTRHLMGLKDWWKSTGPVIQSWTGYDGTPGIKDLTAGLVKRMDLSKPRYIGRTFNWVLSLEVGEHIPRKYQANYISNLVRHAEEGIVLSWAVEGQGGRSHVNNRNNDIIIAILEGHGFYPQPEIWKSLRGNSSLYWFKNTVMTFRLLISSLPNVAAVKAAVDENGGITLEDLKATLD